METVMEYDAIDVPPSAYELADVSEQPAEGPGHVCEDCQTPVSPTKSGRQFSKCIDCRRAARAGGSTATTRRSPNWEGPLASQLVEMIDAIGMGVSFVNATDGQIIRAGSDRLGNALIGPARTNKKVRAALESAVNGGAWAGVVMACAAIAIPIMANHNLLPQAKAKPVKRAPFDAPVAPENVGHINV